MKKEWVVSVRDQCRREGVPFFFKQWGGVRKLAVGRKLNGKRCDEFHQRIRHPVLATAECLSLASKFEAAGVRVSTLCSRMRPQPAHEVFQVLLPNFVDVFFGRPVLSGG